MSVEPAYYKSIIYGGTAHGLEVLVFGHVLDRIKVHCEAKGKDESIRKIAKKIVVNNGAKSLYKGLRWNLLVSTLKGSQGWLINNASNRFVSNMIPELTGNSLAFSVAVSLTTAIVESTLFITPLERMKTIEMTSERKKIPTVYAHFQKHGPGFFFIGLPTVIFRQSITWGSYIGFYNGYRNLFEKNVLHAPNTFLEKTCIGATTGASVCVINSPIDFYKTQKQMIDSLPSKNTYKNLRYLVSKYGVSAFYSNLKIKILRSSISCAFVLTILDYTNALPNNMKIPKKL